MIYLSLNYKNHMNVSSPKKFIAIQLIYYIINAILSSFDLIFIVNQITFKFKKKITF